MLINSFHVLLSKEKMEYIIPKEIYVTISLNLLFADAKSVTFQSRSVNGNSATS